jgi:sulfite exporter TauE/SafE
MDGILHALASCRDGLAQFGAAPAGLAVSLFLAGLAGSTVHCVGMCGPFVLGQVAADAAAPTAGYGEWRRLAGASLVPYHLGRLTTYTGLGALAGAATAVFAASRSFGWIAAALLVVGAAFMLLQAIGLAASVGSPLGSLLSRLAAPLLSSRQTWARYALGVVLGFLPCGLIYGALGAAAGTGSPALGATVMAAFALGTVPALIAVGWGGVLLRRRLQEVGRWVFAPLLVANAVLMLVLAGERLGGVI